MIYTYNSKGEICLYDTYINLNLNIFMLILKVEENRKHFLYLMLAYFQKGRQMGTAKYIFAAYAIIEIAVFKWFAN